ncbi:thioredoxin family protein [Chitinophaga sedimenti]|uniref:thioredoxin family protein n=1 Tax=Chitinophaga sedimenti TaxID=2033606 RepID=UPI002005C3EF|nr:thioredoxin family protein [Chitinophaga sedimenti]MCK7559314.1 thioredoxin family protein [Chitinophaga sedimenti]
MMKYLMAIGCSLLLALPAVAQQPQPKPGHLDSIYNPTANAEAELGAAIKKAAAEKKHVLVQVGGNWCIWCKRLYKYVEDSTDLRTYRDANYVVYHLNYSKENQNLPLLAKYGNPQRFGFPVLLVLDGQGKLLHIQDSGLLESADSYDKRKIMGFFRNWSPAAVNKS